MAPANPQVLVIEDDVNTAELLRRYLVREGYPVLVAHDGAAGVEMARRRGLGLVVLDLMLPQLDGLAVCRTLRTELGSDVPIIVVSARSGERDILLALDLGADDYLTKPFRPRELMARARAVLRRSAPAEPPGPLLMSHGDLVIDARRHRVTRAGERVAVTRREFQLLRVLAVEPGRVFSRAELVSAAFGTHYEGVDRTVDAHIRNLRRKVEPDPTRPFYVQTVYGVGYTFGTSDA